MKASKNEMETWGFLINMATREDFLVLISSSDIPLFPTQGHSIFYLSQKDYVSY